MTSGTRAGSKSKAPCRPENLFLRVTRRIAGSCARFSTPEFGCLESEPEYGERGRAPADSIPVLFSLREEHQDSMSFVSHNLKSFLVGAAGSSQTIAGFVI